MPQGQESVGLYFSENRLGISTFTVFRNKKSLKIILKVMHNNVLSDFNYGFMYVIRNISLASTLLIF